MKKVLAWAVALALVLSSFTMAFAADTKTSADFKDASSINYTEAVDVMVATGVINGFPDGTFGPQKTVKRSEMAKMIAVMMNGGEDIGDQFKGACPFKDSKDHWAAGYIAYCASEHIIDGRSADVFDPEAEVTGTEVAKMALTALGYDSKIQGYTGENWAAAVLKDAKKNDLFEGLMDSFVPANPCDRESAAEILFNALQAVEVEYDNATSVKVGDAEVTVNSKVKEVETTQAQKDKGFGPTLNLYEDVFGGDLVKKAATDNGKPAHEWTFEKESVGTYPDAAEHEFFVGDAESFAKAVKDYDEDLYDDLKDAKETPNIGTVYFNGDQVVPTPAPAGAAAATIAPINGDAFDAIAVQGLALGDKVQLIEEPTQDDMYRAVITHYEPFQITDVDTDISTADAKKDVKAYIYAEKTGDKLTKVKDTEFAGFDASTYVEDAVIAVAKDKTGKIIDSYVLKEAAAGELTAYKGTDAAPTSVTVAGTKYDVTGSFDKLDGKVMKVGNTYTFYDYNDYVIASIQDEDNTTTYYGVLTAVGSNSGTFDSEVVAKVVTADGTEKDFVVDADYVKGPAAGTTPSVDNKFMYDKETYKTGSATDDILVEYTLNDDNEIDFMSKAAGGTKAISGNDMKMKAGGVLANMTVASDVAAFYYDSEAEEYVVYDFAALEGAEKINAKEEGKAYIYVPADSELKALLLGTGLESSEDIIGIIADVDESNVADGKKQAVVTAYVDGKEEKYTTITYKQATEIGSPAKGTNKPVKFVLNGDGELKMVEALTEVSATNEDLATSIADNSYVALNGKTIYEANRSSETLRTSADNADVVWQPIKGAAVYYINGDGDLVIESFAKINANNVPVVNFYQIDKDAAAWNIVVFSDNETAAASKITPAN